MSLCEELKSQGNALYASGAFSEAVEKYTEALLDAPTMIQAVLYGNRAACHFMQVCV